LTVARTALLSRGSWLARVTIAKGQRAAFGMPWCAASDAKAAAARAELLATLAAELATVAEGPALAPRLLAAAAAAPNAAELAKVRTLVARVLAGQYKLASVAVKGSTFADVAKAWSSGDLAKAYPDHVKDKRSARDDAHRFATYVNPVLGPVPMSALTLERIDAVMASLPERLSPASRRQIAQGIARVCKLAVYPLRMMGASPIPPGWLPRVPKGSQKKQEMPRPAEHDRFLASDAPIVVRLFCGFVAREGMRHDEAESLTWADLDVDAGLVRLDENKTDDPRAWALRPGTARALAVWRKMRGDPPRTGLVFTHDDGRPLRLEAKVYREHLRAAGVERAELLEGSKTTTATGLHALRALFVTEALARGESEAWVSDRTGHKSSQMIATYKRRSRGFLEAKLAQLAPLDVALGWASREGDGAEGPPVNWQRIGSRPLKRRRSMLRPKPFSCGGSTGTRTLDLRIKSPQLYRLSYRPARLGLLPDAAGPYHNRRARWVRADTSLWSSGPQSDYPRHTDVVRPKGIRGVLRRIVRERPGRGDPP
jgi:integrase